MLHKAATELLAVHVAAPYCLKDPYSFSSLKFKKMVEEFVQHLSELNVYKKVMGPIILVALTVHHTPTSMSHNEILRINLGLFANQYLLL
jgi:hypothetical protein